MSLFYLLMVTILRNHCWWDICGQNINLNQWDQVHRDWLRLDLLRPWDLCWWGGWFHYCRDRWFFWILRQQNFDSFKLVCIQWLQWMGVCIHFVRHHSNRYSFIFHRQQWDVFDMCHHFWVDNWNQKHKPWLQMV